MVKHWRSREGQEILIADMQNAYLINTYKYLIRMICNKVKDIDGGDAALEDGQIDETEHAFYVDRNRRDLLDFIEQMDAVKAEVKHRGLKL